jgi:hypothetical protein
MVEKVSTIKRENMASILALTLYMTSRHNKIYGAIWIGKSRRRNMAQGYQGERESNGLTNDHPKKY